MALIQPIYNNYKFLSYQLGLIPPESECKIFNFCGCTHHKGESPSTVEQYLASRQHRWKEIRELQADFFKSIASKITDYETDLLKLLRLPAIEVVRQSIIEDDIERTGKFEYTDNMDAGLKRIFKEWETDFIGGIDLKIIKTEEEETQSLFKWFMRLGFVIGFNKIKKLIRAILPDGFSPDFLDRFIANLQNPYFMQMLLNGATRIKSKIAVDNLQRVRRILKVMAKRGDYPLDVARYLHKRIGEGDLWYWLRIARSEAVMAADSAFDDIAKKAGINYERWSAAANACPICSQFDGQVWELSEGPRPVSDTHPHCCCFRMPLYEWRGNIHETWNRPSPYDVPYSENELLGGLL